MLLMAKFSCNGESLILTDLRTDDQNVARIEHFDRLKATGTFGCYLLGT